LAITLTTSLRNLLGPHHHEDGELHWVSPRSFATSPAWSSRKNNHRRASQAYNVVDFGLAADVVLRY